MCCSGYRCCCCCCCSRDDDGPIFQSKLPNGAAPPTIRLSLSSPPEPSSTLSILISVLSTEPAQRLSKLKLCDDKLGKRDTGDGLRLPSDCGGRYAPPLAPSPPSPMLLMWLLFVLFHAAASPAANAASLSSLPPAGGDREESLLGLRCRGGRPTGDRERPRRETTRPDCGEGDR